MHTQAIPQPTHQVMPTWLQSKIQEAYRNKDYRAVEGYNKGWQMYLTGMWNVSKKEEA